MEQIIESLITTVTGFVGSAGYVAVFVLMTVESAFIPIPSEITMPFAGFLVSQGLLSFWGVVIAGSVGNLAGSLIAWYIGIHGEQFTRRFIRNWGKWVLISEHELDIAIHFYQRFGQPITFFSRLLPIIRTYISLPAGIAKMPVVSFSALTLIGSFLWSTLLTWLGVILGENWHTLSAYFRKFDVVILVIGIALIVLYLGYKIKIYKVGQKS